MKVEIMAKHGLKVVDLNRRKAIRERCLNCSAWFCPDVKNCAFTDCPLYSFRAGQGKQNAKARSKAIREYCLWCMNGQLKEVSKCTVKTCPLFPYRNTRTDRSVFIESLPKNGHIEALSEDKTKAAYPNMGKG